MPRLAPIAVLLCLLLVAPAAARADTVAVGGAGAVDGPGCGLAPQPACASIAAGVVTAVDGDTVQVAAGTFVERVAVTEDLTLDGAGTTTVVQSPPPMVGDDAVLDVAGATVTVSDLRLESSGSESGIVARAAAVLAVDRVEIVGAGDGDATGVAQNGVVFRGAASGIVRDSTISGHDCGTADLATCTADPATDTSATGAAGVLAYGSGANGVTVVGSTLTANRYGVRAAGAPRLDVLDTTISGTAGAGIGVAVLDCDAGCGGAGVTAQATQGGVHGSTVTQTGRGVVVRDGAPLDGLRPAPVLHADRIAGNTTSGVSSNVPVDAAGVWWGCNAGPGTTGCDSVGGPVDTAHRLVLRLHAAASSLATGGASTQLTADVTRDADGTARGAAFPDGTPIAFTTALGALSPAAAQTTAGAAGATLTSGDTAGDAAPSATLDGQTVGVAVAFTAPPPPQTVTVTAPAPTPTPTPTAPPTEAQLLADARKAIGRNVVRLGLTLTPGVAYVDRAVRTGKGTLTVADEDVVSLLVLACPEKACDAGVSARVARVSKAGRKLKEYGLRRAEFSLEAGRMRVVAVRLTKAQRDGIRRVRTATMTVVIAVSDPAGNRNKRTLRLTVKVKRAAT